MFAKSWMVSGRITELLFHERLTVQNFQTSCVDDEVVRHLNIGLYISRLSLFQEAVASG